MRAIPKRSKDVAIYLTFALFKALSGERPAAVSSGRSATGRLRRPSRQTDVSGM